MRDEPVLQEEYKGYVIKIWQDEDCESPREWENIAKFYFWHRNYDIGDKHKYSVEEMQDLIKKHKKDWYVFPVTMYDHSGIGFSLNRDSYPYNCPWDSGQVGWIVVEKEDIIKNFPTEFGNKQVRLIQEDIQKKAWEVAKSELDVYNDFVQGNVYGYVIIKERKDDCPHCERKMDDEDIESCWGYFGDPEKEGGAIAEAKSIIDHLTKPKEKNEPS